MPLRYAVLTHVMVDGSGTMTKTIRAPEWMNRDILDPQQQVLRSLGGTPYIYNRGPRIRTVEWRFNYLLPSERADLEDFFGPDAVDLGRRWFTVEVETEHREVIRCGGLVDGVVVACGDGYSCGQRILMDKCTYAARLLDPVLNFEEPEDGHYSIEMKVELLDGFLPSNSCPG